MRINKFIAQNTDFSRRRADQLINAGRVKIDQRQAVIGDQVQPTNQVTIDSKATTG